jgi:hypothetical protein
MNTPYHNCLNTYLRYKTLTLNFFALFKLCFHFHFNIYLFGKHISIKKYVHISKHQLFGHLYENFGHKKLKIKFY